MPAPIPYEFLKPVPAFDLTSTDVQDGGTLSQDQVFDDWGHSGGNISPQLAWSGFPEGTRSFAITVYDPDAPTGSGFWHWLTWDIPAGVTSVERGAPEIGTTGRNDYGQNAFGGAGPPAGETHRYIFAVHALDVAELGVPADATTGQIGFNIVAHTIGRAYIVASYGS
ncbi:YbhB/YbcL family Raf kinase inhibitor-like protein [Actinocorallia longicatena]|uniref:YbhB/YbcL family Raf kinase inhibitor-like protein n=1 Tax=Actinocorallia longicatena TaxID=111803 RepID=A0ABP6Q382_9ACTN